MTNITDEQRAAWLSLVHDLDDFEQSKQELALIAPLLPSELTNPQPALPTEPGVYGYEVGGTTLTFLRTPTGWYAISNSGQIDVCEEAYITQASTPLVPLVPERPQITREQVKEAVYEADVSGSLLDDYIEVAYLSLMNQVNDRD